MEDYFIEKCIKESCSSDEVGRELEIQKEFISSFLSEEDKMLYITLSPLIISSIEEHPSSNLIYDYIYNNIIKDVTFELERGNSEAAYRKYKTSLLILEEHYLKPTLAKKLVKSLNNKTTK